MQINTLFLATFLAIALSPSGANSFSSSDQCQRDLAQLTEDLRDDADLLTLNCAPTTDGLLSTDDQHIMRTYDYSTCFYAQKYESKCMMLDGTSNSYDWDGTCAPGPGGIKVIGRPHCLPKSCNETQYDKDTDFEELYLARLGCGTMTLEQADPTVSAAPSVVPSISKAPTSKPTEPPTKSPTKSPTAAPKSSTPAPSVSSAPSTKSPTKSPTAAPKSPTPAPKSPTPAPSNSVAGANLNSIGILVVFVITFLF